MHIKSTENYLVIWNIDLCEYFTKAAYPLFMSQLPNDSHSIQMHENCVHSYHAIRHHSSPKFTHPIINIWFALCSRVIYINKAQNFCCVFLFIGLPFTPVHLVALSALAYRIYVHIKLIKPQNHSFRSFSNTFFIKCKCGSLSPFHSFFVAPLEMIENCSEAYSFEINFVLMTIELLTHCFWQNIAVQFYLFSSFELQALR